MKLKTFQKKILIIHLSGKINFFAMPTWEINKETITAWRCEEKWSWDQYKANSVGAGLDLRYTAVHGNCKYSHLLFIHAW